MITIRKALILAGILFTLASFEAPDDVLAATETVKLSTVMPATNRLRVRSGVIGPDYMSSSYFPDSAMTDGRLYIQDNTQYSSDTTKPVAGGITMGDWAYWGLTQPGDLTIGKYDQYTFGTSNLSGSVAHIGLGSTRFSQYDQCYFNIAQNIYLDSSYNARFFSNGAGSMIQMGRTTNTETDGGIFFQVSTTSNNAGAGAAATLPLVLSLKSGLSTFYYPVQFNVSGHSVRLTNAFTGASKYLEYYVDGAAYGVTMWASSKRFKENITDLELDSTKIYDLKPVSFNWKPERGGKKDFGMIAEEVEKIFPSLVSYDAEGKPFIVRYELLSVLLLNELKKKSAEIDDLKRQNKNFEERIGRLEKRD